MNSFRAAPSGDGKNLSEYGLSACLKNTSENSPYPEPRNAQDLHFKSKRSATLSCKKHMLHKTFPEMHLHSKTKVSSRRSIGYLFAALNNDESRGKFTVSIYDDHFPRADAGAHAGGGG
jgi:hypothetical protein